MSAGNASLMAMHGNMGMDGMSMSNMGDMNAMAGGMGMDRIDPMGQNPIGMSQPSNQPMGAQNILLLLSAAGYTCEQFMAMSNEEMQILMQKIMSMWHYSRKHLFHLAQQSLHLPPYDIM
ncbi:hypothetical protein AX16_009885 [Volvariella volvacea WC 439]|nr:hypothetical protein AX16_009885 [Volvariella volvacea WC 439]